jgi:hypothetical protein
MWAVGMVAAPPYSGFSDKKNLSYSPLFVIHPVGWNESRT